MAMGLLAWVAGGAYVDPLTQGIFGAVAAQSIASRAEVRAATVAGALGGMAADLDVLIRSDQDPLLFLDYHRHFTHALAFIPVGGAVVGLALWPLLRHHLTLTRLLLFAIVGYGTHGLLDACTSYGTRLLWPFSSLRVAWNIVAVVDPTVTLPLLVLVVLAVVRRSARLARVAAVVATALLGLGAVQHARATDLLERTAGARGHVVVRGGTKPTLLNMLLWRGVWQSGDVLYVAALRPGIFGPDRISDVQSAPLFVAERDLPTLPPDSQQARDVARFAHFSDGWLVRLPDEDGQVVIGDFRYATLPDAIAPLWGIAVDVARPDDHVRYLTMRSVGPGLLSDFGCRVSGDCLVPVAPLVDQGAPRR